MSDMNDEAVTALIDKLETFRLGDDLLILRGGSLDMGDLWDFTDTLRKTLGRDVPLVFLPDGITLETVSREHAIEILRRIEKAEKN